MNIHTSAGATARDFANVDHKGSEEATTPSDRDRLEATCRIGAVQPLVDTLRSRVTGQDEALDKLICSFSRLLSGLHDTSRPLLTALFLGPTGVGKTETAKALAQALFGSERALTRINCEEYAHGHEISKLLGSPPGYVGFGIEPLLSQNRIDGPHRELRAKSPPLAEPVDELGFAETLFPATSGSYVSVILFDEIEKADPKLWNALLGILEDGMLTLGDNSTTDFTQSIILMTTNIGSFEMSKMLDRRPMGFRTEATEQDSGELNVRDVALEAARKAFPFEFLNRFDEILAFGALEHEHLDGIFDKFLADIHDRALRQAGVPLLIKPSEAAREAIIDRGTDPRFGARPLRRAMEHEIVDPLSRLIASGAIEGGDIIDIELEGDELIFFRRVKTSKAVVS